MYCCQYDSPLGKLLLTCRDEGLTGIWFDKEVPEFSKEENHPVLQQTRLWLDAYFRRENPPMEIPLFPEGRDFQKQVWNLLRQIPYGEIRSYGSIAKKLATVLGRDTMSAQAVGQAVGRNPISILIPCHRVVGTKGQLTGYASGLYRKQWLLCLEGRQVENDSVL